jgi:hypothetical protein
MAAVLPWALDFNQCKGDFDEVVTGVVNQLLRDLDYAVDRNTLSEAVASRDKRD